MIRTMTLAATLLTAACAAAQEGSLIYSPVRQPQPGATVMNNSAWIYQALPPEAMSRPLEKESIVTVLVDYRSVMLSEGSGESIKTGSFSAVLSDWIKFDGKDLFPAPQRRGDPSVSGTLNSQLRAESEIEQRESLTFAMAVKVVDIRPNGNLVLEGRSEVQNNEEIWMVYLSGEVARQQIGPDWTVRDTSLANKRIKKYEVGAVHDGYARGWLNQWYGKYKPF
ncbi:flagellar basal body L-ring protein [Planctomycetes bacterium MalM25]|nr:flagellar basal body L-ring protein [Planctomycetes bacterium MalM25]